MNRFRTIGIALIILGVVAFGYQGVITFRTKEKVIDAGPIQVTREEKHEIPVPPIVGAAALIGGITLLILAEGRHQPKHS